MITASVVLYKNSINEVKTIVKCIIDSKIISKIYLIDNSPDNYLQLTSTFSPIIEYIINDNTGYGSSHNIALRKSVETGNLYHIVLNPDITFESNVIEVLKNYMDDHLDTVYILPKVLYPDGKMQYLCKLLPTPFDLIFRRFFPKNKLFIKLNEKYILKKASYNKTFNPPCLSGCFMFLRLSTLVEHNIFFDDNFFMYFEDFDIIRRLHRVGKTIYYPEVSIIHNHQKASYKSLKMLSIHIDSAIKYFNKYGWFFDKERRIMNKKVIREIDELQSFLPPSQNL